MGIKNFFGGVGRKIVDHKADLLMGFGTVGVIGGTIQLCRETLRLPDILEEYQEAKAELEEKEDKKEIGKLRAKTAGRIILNFAPGVLIEGAGLGGMWGGYTDMKAAFVGASLTCGKLMQFIDTYREGVREKFGEDADAELTYGCHTEEVVTVAEDGTQTTETVKVYPSKKTGMPSLYARYFAYGEADAAEKSATYNKHFLELQQDAANRYLRTNRKLMLNTVYEWLGIKTSVAGNRVGWIYDKTKPEGDNYIDFRIQEVYRQKEDGDGWEKVFMIDPNVDGPVEEKMVRLGLMDE